jgi:hypothetical protein
MGCIMKKVLFCLTLTLVILQSGCSEDSATKSTPICFGVSGFNVHVYNMWTNGSIDFYNVQGVGSFNVETSSGGESHSLHFTNIVNNYTTYTTDSFNVTIDGKAYSYPANACTN